MTGKQRAAAAIAAFAAFAFLGFAGSASAGDFHFGVDLICSDCHVMHYSQSHAATPSGTGLFTPLANGPNHFLLRNDINELCLSCHDAQSFAPDVFESHSNGYVRQAGALNEEGGNGLYPPATGHTLNSTAEAPGSNPAWSDPDGLKCTNCHSPHGRAPSGFPAAGGYRNLYSPTGKGIKYSRGDVEGANPLTTAIHEDVSSGVNANHYGVGAVTFNEPDLLASQYADFCKSCHTNFHGAVGGAEIGGVGTPPEEFVRHPMAEVNIGAIGGGHSQLSRLTGKVNQVHVMSPTGQKAGGYNGTDTGLTPSCMSCHKGHGNQNSFGLVFMVGTGTVTEQGDAGTDARNTCRQCHGMGGAATNPW
jgi:hypothetical protein